MKANGENFAKLFNKVSQNERQKSPLIRLWLSRQKLEEVKFKDFDSKFPGFVQKGYFSEYLSAVCFLEKCHKKDNKFFDNFPVAALRPFFHKLKNVSDDEWKTSVNAIKIKLENEPIITQKVVNKVCKELSPRPLKKR